MCQNFEGGFNLDITVLIPTMDEPAVQDVIKDVFIALEEHNVDVIVIDKSSDDTPIRAEQAGARVIFQLAKGYGDAYLTGFKYATGDIICMLDGDRTYDPMELPSLLEPILREQADFVLGNRFANLKEGAMSSRNKLGNQTITAFVNRLYDLQISDSQSGMRAFRREMLDDVNLNLKGMPFATEMIIEARRAGVRIAEVPISYYPRVGSAKLLPFRHGASIFGTLLRMLRDYNPLLLFGSIGFLLIISGILVGLLPVLGWIIPISTSNLTFTILSVLLILSGLQVLLFGLMADILVRKFHQ
jgi:glycosyltransferase involved in cell wall biosynthesis